MAKGKTERQKHEKWHIINAFGNHDRDTGSTNVQIQLLNDRIKKLQFHSKNNQKDYDVIASIKKLKHYVLTLQKYAKRKKIYQY